VEKLAVDPGCTFTQIVEDALRLALPQRTARKRARPVKLHTFGGKGLQPGVDLSSNAAVEDLMNQHDGSIGR